MMRWALVFAIPAVGCGGSTLAYNDPQLAITATEQPPGQPAVIAQQPASAIVICPDGSSYDPSRNVCVATDKLMAQPDTETTKTSAQQGDSTITVQCKFRNGWVSVLPEDQYPQDDSFLMQALIGLTEEPNFWSNEAEYEDLAPWAARRCTESTEPFRVSAGRYFILVGEADTFGARGRYHKNGIKRRVTVTSASPTRVVLSSSDLTHTWNCISCPFVALWNPHMERYMPSFVILPHRASSRDKGTHRVMLKNAPVKNGKLRLRIVEAESEVSHIDQLVVLYQGKTILPSKGLSRSALSQVDGTELLMSRGHQVTVEYDLPGAADGEVDLELSAHGYYEPVVTHAN